LTEEKMTLIEHLDELRKRAIRILIGAFIGTIVGYYCYDLWILNLLKGPLDSLGGVSDNPFVFNNPLLTFLKQPSDKAQNLRLDLHFIGPLEVFMMKLNVSFFAGMLMASPYIFYQVWAFVATGLTEKERKLVRILVPVSVILFFIGCLFAYFMVLPVALYFLVVVSANGLVPMLVISKYVSLVVICCAAFGIVFEIPLIILFLTRIGIVSPMFLAEKRKYAILLMITLAAILTPTTDVVNLALMSVPMIVLYEISIWLSRMAWRRRQNRQMTG
jgi:sec-independent protein translocase protein TatC